MQTPSTLLKRLMTVSINIEIGYDFRESDDYKFADAWLMGVLLLLTSSNRAVVQCCTLLSLLHIAKTKFC